jgi:hypothetical protein
MPTLEQRTEPVSHMAHPGDSPSPAASILAPPSRPAPVEDLDREACPGVVAVHGVKPGSDPS